MSHYTITPEAAQELLEEFEQRASDNLDLDEEMYLEGVVDTIRYLLDGLKRPVLGEEEDEWSFE